MPFLIYFGEGHGYCHAERCDTAEEAVWRYYAKYPNAKPGAQARRDSVAWASMKGESDGRP